MAEQSEITQHPDRAALRCGDQIVAVDQQIARPGGRQILRQRLPILPIPLRKTEPPVPLDLQALVDQTYERGRYDDLSYTDDLDPPLSSEESDWIKQILKTAGRK